MGNRTDLTDDEIWSIYEEAKRDNDGRVMTLCEIATGDGAFAETCRQALAPIAERRRSAN